MEENKQGLFTEAFSSIKPKGDRLKFKMVPLFWEKLLDFHTQAAAPCFGGVEEEAGTRSA